MLDLPEPGLYRTTQAMPGNESEFPANVLVFIGQTSTDGGRFIVRPRQNRRNRWFWGEPTTPFRSPTYAKTLRRLPSEGFYTLPRIVELSDGGRWLANAIVELGYNDKGQGIIFVAQWQESGDKNVLQFSERGLAIDDSLLDALRWAPILPVKEPA